MCVFCLFVGWLVCWLVGLASCLVVFVFLPVCLWVGLSVYLCFCAFAFLLCVYLFGSGDHRGCACSFGTCELCIPGSAGARKTGQDLDYWAGASQIVRRP